MSDGTGAGSVFKLGSDRLVSATVGTTTETYTWTGDGIRRSASTGPQAVRTTGFVVDRTQGAGNVVAERTGSGTLVRRYTYGLDLLAQTTSNKGPDWYHHDGLGSVTDITSATGASLAWTTYTPFGTIRASAATSQAPVNPFRFSGAYLDGSTALYHLRARQYDPSTGRFTAVDPVSPGIGDPYVGAYVYVDNNPVRYVDPSGRDTDAVCLTAEIFIGVGFFQVAICPVVSVASGQIGITGALGFGGGIGAGGTAGVSYQHSNGTEIYDLEGAFVIGGGSAAAGVGGQSEAFVGPGHCGQIVGGGSGGFVIGAGASGKVGASYTAVFGLGNPRSTCGSKP